MSASEPIGHGLNPAQKEAVLYLDGPCLVLAGAGQHQAGAVQVQHRFFLRGVQAVANGFACGHGDSKKGERS